MAIEIGRVCVKTAGRDAGKRCVVIDIIDSNFVMIDGETRRKRSNISHLEPLSQKLEIKKGASHDELKEIFQKLGIGLKDRKTDPPSTEEIKEDKKETQKLEKKSKSKK